MDVLDFISREEFKELKTLVDGRKKFKHERSVKSGGTVHRIRVSSREIDEKLANDIWHGHRYLCNFSYDYCGKKGTGGKGYSTEELTMFNSFEDFTTWLENNTKHEEGFELAEVQLCLW